MKLGKCEGCCRLTTATGLGGKFWCTNCDEVVWYEPNSGQLERTDAAESSELCLNDEETQDPEQGS